MTSDFLHLKRGSVIDDCLCPIGPYLFFMRKGLNLSPSATREWFCSWQGRCLWRKSRARAGQTASKAAAETSARHWAHTPCGDTHPACPFGLRWLSVITLTTKPDIVKNELPRHKSLLSSCTRPPYRDGRFPALEKKRNGSLNWA